ncbi:MAG: RNB domain-containing ribonuclease [Desulfobacterales bacterium]|nr:RNB domain-containing ribonuclease [Desulfobacterales bacterium]
MESGKIVEYIDRQSIVCAVVVEIKKNRLRLLTETNREVNMSESRLSHVGKTQLDLSLGRGNLVGTLKNISSHRKALMGQIEIRELWEILHTEQQWIDLMSMTEFCFPDHPADDHESAVVRAFFVNRTYFKFNFDSFFPHSEEQVCQIISRDREAERRNALIEEGGAWLKKISEDKKPALPEDKIPLVNILKSFYLFGKEDSDFTLAKAILQRAGFDDEERVFQLLVKLGVWDPHENIELLRQQVPTTFSDDMIRHAQQLTDAFSTQRFEDGRRDLTHLALMTIDGQSTLDFDDALSIEEINGGYALGVHIADVSHFIKKDDILDREALSRASSIYMPDLKIPMFPPSLAEGLLSLKAGMLRPAITVMINFNKSFEILDYDIFPSLVNIRHQLTYSDVDLVASENRPFYILQKIAGAFRLRRLAQGAIPITLPDINIGFGPDGKPTVTLSDRESPGRMLVAEIMIMANWLMARFLNDHQVPAIFRAQPEPREHLLGSQESSLFQNWMQRKVMSRFMLCTTSAPHSGLGMNAYVTATSPIRKYVDLVTQRQIRSVLGLEQPYTAEEIDTIIQLLEQPMMAVSRLQHTRSRYWLLKHLESRIRHKSLAIVLTKRRRSFAVLLTDYLLECDLPVSGGISLKPEDLVQVTIQQVNARKDAISIYLG